MSLRATMVGVGTGALGAAAFIFLMGGRTLSDVTRWAIAGAVIGLVVGSVAQSWVRLARGRLLMWIGAAAGWATATALATIVLAGDQDNLDGIVFRGLFGGPIGALVVLAMRRFVR